MTEMNIVELHCFDILRPRRNPMAAIVRRPHDLRADLYLLPGQEEIYIPIRRVEEIEIYHPIEWHVVRTNEISDSHSGPSNLVVRRAPIRPPLTQVGRLPAREMSG